MNDEKKRKFNKYSLFLIPAMVLFVFSIVIFVKAAGKAENNVSQRGRFQARTEEMRQRLNQVAEEEKQKAAEKAAENARLQREAESQSRLVRSPLVTPVGNGED